MNYYVYIGIVIFVFLLFYQFPLLQLHREGKKRKINVSPPILSIKSLTMFRRYFVCYCVEVFYLGTLFLLWFGIPYYLFAVDILERPTGWWFLLYCLVWFGWTCIVIGIWSLFTDKVNRKIDQMKGPLLGVEEKLKEIKSKI